jgi:hypothetical protein
LPIRKSICTTRPGIKKNSGFLPDERAWMDKLYSNGWIDTFRLFHAEPHQYTWWSQRFPTVRDENKGWRLDYISVTENLRPYLKGAGIYPDVKHSDHCPVYLELDAAALNSHAMIVYNITVNVDWSIAAPWLQWFTEEQAPEIVATGCFSKYHVLQLLQVDEADGPYLCPAVLCKPHGRLRKLHYAFCASFSAESIRPVGRWLYGVSNLMAVVCVTVAILCRPNPASSLMCGRRPC